MKITAPSGALGKAIGEAAAIAGSARLDSLKGVLIAHSPTHGLTVQAATEHTTFMRTVHEAEVEVDETDGRRIYVPAKIAGRLFSRMQAGVPCTLQDHDGISLKIKSGRLKASMFLLNPDAFPRLHWFEEDMVEVSDFARQLKRVAFAAGNKGVLAGVLLDGKHLTATNSNIMASVRCDLPLDGPVVLPLVETEKLLRSSDSVSMAKPLPSGSFVFNYDNTQLTMSTLKDPYPKVDDWRGFIEKYDDAQLSFNPADLKLALDRMAAIGDEDSQIAFVRLKLNDDSIKLGVNVEEVGEMVDEIDAQVERPSALTYTMALPQLRSILQAWGHRTFVMDYCSTDNLKVFAARDEEYTVLWMPVKDPKARTL
jgi:DNA polymerase III sliding clamp (beta) subunit (PCNA family)